jgi:hypothetical protein
VSLAPLDLISAHPWQRVTFTTYALSLSFFEAVILDRLIRAGGREAMILADIDGVRASLSEQGAQRVGKDYEVEPVSVSSGVFHPKISVLSGTDECHLLVGSGNLTFGGWGGNYEVLEHLHPGFAADAIADAAEFFERLSVTERARHGARAHCATVAGDLRAAVQGKTRNGDIRLFHNLDASISEQLVRVADELGGATRLLVAAPFWDQGAAIDALCKAMKLDEVFIHAHATGVVEGFAGSNWPFGCDSKIHPVRLEIMDDPRRLHAKTFEIMCRQGRILVSGSPNGSTAALGRNGNVEACVVRIQRDRTFGWKFIASETPDAQASLEDEAEEEEQRRGILRAVLDVDELHGEILTPAMSGAISVFYLSNLGAELLAETTLSDDGRFQVNTPTLENKSWLEGRLVIRVQDQHGRQAEGFVSVASFTEVSRRTGIVGRRLMALLAGTETPADVAAIISWFYEDPRRLADVAPGDFGGGSIGADAPKEPVEVIVADLSGAAVAAATAVAAMGHAGSQARYSRFMEQIFAAFRQKRGSFGRAGAGGKGDDDRDDDDEQEQDRDDDRDRKRDDEDDPAIKRSLSEFEKLFDLLVRPDAVTRQLVMAFDLAEYICERLKPERTQAQRWLDRLIPALMKAGVPAERRDEIAAAILTNLGATPKPWLVRRTRGLLLDLGVDFSGGPPPADGVIGFQSVLPQQLSFTDLWPQLLAIRTYQEQVRCYLAALKNGGASGGFADLKQAAEEEWPDLEKALMSKEPFKKIIVLDRFRDACPHHNIMLPTGEVGKLKLVRIATTKNCCHRILIWPGDS